MLTPKFNPQDKVYAEIDSVGFWTTVKYATFNSVKGEFQYSLNGIKGTFFSEKELSLLGEKSIFEHSSVPPQIKVGKTYFIRAYNTKMTYIVYVTEITDGGILAKFIPLSEIKRHLIEKNELCLNERNKSTGFFYDITFAEEIE